MPFHSQFDEDRWITRAITLPKTPQTFCEVGAFDGIASSNTLFFEEDLGWNGLLIEPSRANWELCRQNRKGTSLCVAIGSKCGHQWFYQPTNDYGRGSLLKTENTYNWEVFVIPLHALWKSFYDQSPYLLSIDTEGTELDVWASRGDMAPEIVIIEYLQWGSDEKKQPICQQLSKDGYRVVRCTEANLIFVKNDSDHCLPAAP